MAVGPYRLLKTDNNHDDNRQLRKKHFARCCAGTKGLISWIHKQEEAVILTIRHMISRLRVSAGLSQEQFAALFGVSRQSVQKWESGVSVPELEKLIKIAKYFDVSLDALALESDARITEELNFSKRLKPKYANLHEWESYSSNLLIEYQQAVEEGLDIQPYEDVFAAVARLPKNEIKKRLGDILFDVVLQAKTAKGYQYIEPSTLEGNKAVEKWYRATAVR